VINPPALSGAVPAGYILLRKSSALWKRFALLDVRQAVAHSVFRQGGKLDGVACGPPALNAVLCRLMGLR